MSRSESSYACVRACGRRFFFRWSCVFSIADPCVCVCARACASVNGPRPGPDLKAGLRLKAETVPDSESGPASRPASDQAPQWIQVRAVPDGSGMARILIGMPRAPGQQP